MYQTPDKKYWKGRTDEEDGTLGWRWHQRIKLIDLSRESLQKLEKGQNGIVLIGFMSDEGVRRNKGRVGAKEGPEALRKACANLADHLPDSNLLYDGGNVICEGSLLEHAQKELERIVKVIVSAGYFPLVFGGGHEVAFPHFSGLFHGIPRDQVIGTINIDAHFDLRTPAIGSSSGTSFSDIANLCQVHSYPFQYFCIGIQAPYNTKALYEKARLLDVEFITGDTLDWKLSENQAINIYTFINKCDLVYLTICMDVFDASFAPGVSSPSACGITPALAMDVIRHIKSSGKLLSANIAELNPSLDQDARTAKLAARLAYEIISETDFYRKK